MLYTRRYINVTKLPNGRVRSPNFNAGRGDEDLARWSFILIDVYHAGVLLLLLLNIKLKENYKYLFTF